MALWWTVTQRFPSEATCMFFCMYVYIQFQHVGNLQLHVVNRCQRLSDYAACCLQCMLCFVSFSLVLPSVFVSLQAQHMSMKVQEQFFNLLAGSSKQNNCRVLQLYTTITLVCSVQCTAEIIHCDSVTVFSTLLVHAVQYCCNLLWVALAIQSPVYFSTYPSSSLSQQFSSSTKQQVDVEVVSPLNLPCYIYTTLCN